MFKNILVPVDGSEHAKRAIEYAADVSAKYDASLTLIHVMTRLGSDRIPEELREIAKVEHIEATEADVLKAVASGIMNSARDLAQAHDGRDVQTIIQQGNPAKTIVAYSDENDIDLIVMGRRGLGDLTALFVGSVSHKVAHLAKCACMTVGVPGQ
jgi:nucleotide-binding universal stress UspA family protein